MLLFLISSDRRLPSHRLPTLLSSATVPKSCQRMEGCPGKERGILYLQRRMGSFSNIKNIGAFIIQVFIPKNNFVCLVSLVPTQNVQPGTVQR
jgi:hypothetical protein